MGGQGEAPPLTARAPSRWVTPTHSPTHRRLPAPYPQGRAGGGPRPQAARRGQEARRGDPTCHRPAAAAGHAPALWPRPFSSWSRPPAAHLLPLAEGGAAPPHSRPSWASVRRRRRGFERWRGPWRSRVAGCVCPVCHNAFKIVLLQCFIYTVVDHELLLHPFFIACFPCSCQAKSPSGA